MIWGEKCFKELNCFIMTPENSVAANLGDDKFKDSEKLQKNLWIEQWKKQWHNDSVNNTVAELTETGSDPPHRQMWRHSDADVLMKRKRFESCTLISDIPAVNIQVNLCVFLLPLAKPGLKIASAKMQSYLYFSHTLSAGVNVASACLHVQVYVCVVFKPFLFLFSVFIRAKQ